MASETADTPMETPGVYLVIVSSVAVLLVASFMLVEFAFGPSEAAKAKAAHDAHMQATAPATKPG